MSVARVGAVLAAFAIAAALAAAALPRAESAAERADRIAGELRCPVCQGLSVRDSPSETSRAIREVVAQRIAEGRSDQEIRDEFRAAYGDWILLSPPVLDWRGLAWLAPPLVLLAGIVFAIRHSRARAPGDVPAREPSAEQLAALRARVAREEALDL